MLGRQRQISGWIQMLVDAALFGVAFFLAYWLRTQWQFEVFGGTKEIQSFLQYRWLLVVVLPGGPLALHALGFYSRSLLASRHLTAWLLAKGCFWTTVATILVMWLFRQSGDIGRSVLVFFGFTSFVLIFAKEEVLRWHRMSLGLAHLKKRLILVGTPEDTARLEQDLIGHGAQELDVVSHVDINRTPVEDLVDTMHLHSANGVVLTAKHTMFGQLEKAIEVCEREGVEVRLVASFFKTQISRTTVDEMLGQPMVVFRSGPEASWQGVAKQMLDFMGSTVLLAVLALPMLFIALAIRISSPGPVLFRQKRSGLNGATFTMLKFRSMVSDAEQRKRELEDLNEMSGPVFKVSEDPRITPLGRFLRNKSIDEWPQLVNVWRGEMSLVGPRPLPVDEVRRFDDLSHRRRLSVKPGLTCLWQISGRNDMTDFKEWVRLDLEYIDNWSFWLDLKILVRTVPVVLTGSGAR